VNGHDRRRSWRPPRPPARAAGFTLLEMIVALALFALMAGVLFGSLRVAARSWDGGEAKAAQTSDIRQTEQFLREHLSSQYPQRLRKVVELPLLFSGSSGEIRYAAALPARVDDGGVYYFRLVVAKEGDRSRLVLERTLPDLDATGDVSFTGAERSVLAEDIEEIRIDYFGPAAGSADAVSPTWRDRWDDRQRLPMLVRIDIRPRNGPAWPLLVVEPRRAPEAGCRNWDPVQHRCIGQA
jgi:general secretion pathway protein J